MKKLVLLLVCSAFPAWAAPQYGFSRGRPVIFEMVDHRPILEGDIILDHMQAHPGNAGSRAVGQSYGQYLWPKIGGIAQIPYIVSNGTPNLPAAIAQFNATFQGVIQLVAQTTQTDYVSFSFDANNLNGTCESSVGRVGGEQVVTGAANCSLGTLLHELGHVAGLYHEHSRSDRNSYVTFNFGNVIKGSVENFTQLTDASENLTAYDYASVMSYVPYAFTRNGGVVLESIPPGIPLSNTQGYTPADIDGIKRLYGEAPQAVTIASNPPGLSVIVDGATVKAPQSFSWAMRSTHTLGIPANAQMQNGAGFSFARWSDSEAAAHSIHVAPGNGSVGFPATSPAVTTYTANFVALSPYTASASPSSEGSVTVSPQPATYPGLAGQYFVSRQSVTLTPVPAAGAAFLTWGGTSAPWSQNPKVMTVPDLGAPLAVTAYMSTQPITTITTDPPGLGFQVDGNYWYGPQNFASDFFPNWTAGSSHVVTTWTPQQQYSVNTRFVWKSWSDGGKLKHTIIVPAGASTVTGTFQPQFVPLAWQEPGCASTITISPASASGFYNAGTAVKITSAAASGWTLDGWLYDLTGLSDPHKLVVNDEELAVAAYNTTKPALRVSALTPGYMTAGGTGGTVKITGAGFTDTSIVFVNNAYRTSNFVSRTEIDVALSASDIAAQANIPIGVSNFPDGAVCSSYQAATFQVRQ